MKLQGCKRSGYEKKLQYADDLVLLGDRGKKQMYKVEKGYDGKMFENECEKTMALCTGNRGVVVSIQI